MQDLRSFVCHVRAYVIDSPDTDTFYAKLAEWGDQRGTVFEAAWPDVCPRLRSMPCVICPGGNPDCKSLDMDDRSP